MNIRTIAKIQSKVPRYVGEVIELLQANDEQAIKLFLGETLEEIDNAAKESGDLAKKNVDLLKKVVDAMEEMETASHGKMGGAMTKLDDLVTKKVTTEMTQEKERTAIESLTKKLEHLEIKKAKHERELKEEQKKFAEKQLELMEKEAKMVEEGKRQEDLILAREREEDRKQEAEWETRILSQEKGHQEQALQDYNQGIAQSQTTKTQESQETRGLIFRKKKYTNQQLEDRYRQRNDEEQAKYDRAIQNFEQMRQSQQERRDRERQARQVQRERERQARAQLRHNLEQQLANRKKDLVQVQKEIANTEEERKQLELTVKDMDLAADKKLQSELQLVEIDSQLRGLTIEKSAQESIIEELHQAIFHINDLRQKWTKIQDFFHHVTEKIRMDINVELEKLKKNAEKSGSPTVMSPFVKKKLIRNAWYIIHSSSVLECIASTFSKVSAEHFMPLADNFGSFLTYNNQEEASRALDTLKNDTNAATAQIKQMLPEVESELKTLLDARKEDFEEAIQEMPSIKTSTANDTADGQDPAKDGFDIVNGRVIYTANAEQEDLC